MTIEQWTAVDSYLEAALVPPDPVLAAALAASEAAGLPAIQVSASQGKLLQLLGAFVVRGRFWSLAPWALTAPFGWRARSRPGVA